MFYVLSPSSILYFTSNILPEYFWKEEFQIKVIRISYKIYCQEDKFFFVYISRKLIKRY